MGYYDTRDDLRKRLGSRRLETERDDWNRVKQNVMMKLVRQKFTNPDLKKKLLATGNEHIMEGNTWGDDKWGVVARKKGNRYELDGDDDTGNYLGKILMKLRSEFVRGGP